MRNIFYLCCWEHKITCE